MTAESFFLHASVIRFFDDLSALRLFEIVFANLDPFHLQDNRIVSDKSLYNAPVSFLIL